MQSINPVATAISMGASFVARSFSGDREQLVALIKAGIAHPGCALLDVISPCVTFNDHEGSTKSYAYTREHKHQAIAADYVPLASEITARYGEGQVISVELHDGSHIVLKKADADFDPTRRSAALAYLEKHRDRGEIPTGLLFIDEHWPEMHAIYGTAAKPLKEFAFQELNPGREALKKLQRSMR
jgi:2-oxoglutarate ferredoxin oxidoreductase subunit beta